MNLRIAVDFDKVTNSEVVANVAVPATLLEHVFRKHVSNMTYKERQAFLANCKQTNVHCAAKRAKGS